MLCSFFNRVSALKFHHDLNTIHKDVKFTYELEHNKLAFLDVGLDNSTGSLELSVHGKPTHTGLYNKWESLAPLKYKTNLIRNLLHRAYRICSNSRLLKNEIQAITNLLKKNCFPGWIIRNITQKFFNKQRDIDKKLNKSDQSTKRSNKQMFVFLKLQYLHRISTQIEKEIRDFLKHYEIRLVVSLSTFNIGKLFSYKDCQSLLHSVGEVYQLTCSCGQKHFGQTKRNLITRLNEHRTRQSSEICRHLMENPKHNVNFDSPIILDRSNYSTELRIKETLHIAKRQPQLNVGSQSLSLFLFNA